MDGRQNTCGYFLEFGCTGLDVWTELSENVDFENSAQRYKHTARPLSIVWYQDACQWDHLDVRERLGMHCGTIVKHIKRVTLPCHVIQTDCPEHPTTSTEELGDVLLYSPATAHERTECVRGDGFSAKLKDDDFPYTVRVALWALYIRPTEQFRPLLHSQKKPEIGGMLRSWSLRDQTFAIAPRSEVATVSSTVATTLPTTTTIDQTDESGIGHKIYLRKTNLGAGSKAHGTHRLRVLLNISGGNKHAVILQSLSGFEQ